jgi:hypothetical protein
MKKIVTLSILLMGIVKFSYSQLTMITTIKNGTDTVYVSVFGTINNLMEARKNAFKDKKDRLLDVDSTNKLKFYATEETFGAPTEKVVDDEKNNYSYYVSYYNLINNDQRKIAVDVVNDVVKFINMAANKSAEAKYTAKDIHETSGEYTTQLIDKEGNLVMELITGPGENWLKIVFYSTSYGKA